MAFFIDPEECTACGACTDVCPVECIVEGDDFYTITAADCTDCGECAEVCPVECIAPAE